MFLDFYTINQTHDMFSGAFAFQNSKFPFDLDNISDFLYDLEDVPDNLQDLDVPVNLYDLDNVFDNLYVPDNL